MTREIPPAAIELIKLHEGLEDGDKDTPGLDPYICPTGWVTIGWGHVVRDPDTGRMLRGRADLPQARALFPDGITIEEAQALLDADAPAFGADVERLVEVPLTDGQFAALVSFTFNLGAGRLATSTLLRKLNAGDYRGAADELPRWNKGEDPKTKQLVVLSGLVKRRAQERELFLADV